MDAADEYLPAEPEAVQDALLAWYAADHRAFPWRETDDPYEILVSEVMSQQTQLDRIVEPWKGFVDRWPDVESLAAADRADVVAFWTDNNLGYNNRARYLHEAAEQVLDEFDGEFPDSPEALESLMGVGPYTANAVASFAFNTGEAVVDTNVKRVLYRAFDVPDDDTAFDVTAGELMPDGESRAWNNAIMELGGVACTKSPACDEAACPWRRWCEAYRTGEFEAPDVPAQSTFEGSRRQMRGRVIEALSSNGPLSLAELGPRVRVDYVHDTEDSVHDPEDHEHASGDHEYAHDTDDHEHASGDHEDAPDPEDHVHATDDHEDAPADPENGRSWLRSLLQDLEADGLVEVMEDEDPVQARLKR